ncbi:MAG: response regulator transcription factor [Desulfosarcinaceae bacterium]
MIKILIVDDHPLFRSTLKTIIEKQDGMTVVAEAQNGIEALKQVKRHQPDVILMDVSMPEMDGIDATRQIRAEFSGIKIIALTSYAEEFYKKKMMEAGANDYLSKICSRGDLIECIISVWSEDSATGDESGDKDGADTNRP